MNAVDLPLAAFERFRTSDLDEARRHATLLLSAHGLQPLRREARPDVRYHCVNLLDTSIICAQYGAAVRLDPGALETFYLVGMPLEGTSTVTCGGREIVTRPGLASVQSCTQPMVTEWGDDCRKLSIKIGRAALERRLTELIGRPPKKPVVFDLALDLERGPGQSWRRLLSYLLGELSPDSVYLSSQSARRSLDEAVISTLLFAQRHSYTDALLTEPGLAATPRHVRRAEEIVAADPASRHTLAALAAQTGTSVRSLQTGFRRHRGMTPVEFIRAQRLEKARRALLDPAPGTRITAIAFDVGYEHLGRFARDYKARYGESPSHTLARSAGRDA
jgi:AraC-like DNA-binding protein